jgi:hypothetical protein
MLEIGLNKPISAPVAQWIEQRISELTAQLHPVFWPQSLHV